MLEFICQPIMTWMKVYFFVYWILLIYSLEYANQENTFSKLNWFLILWMPVLSLIYTYRTEPCEKENPNMAMVIVWLALVIIIILRLRGLLCLLT